MVADLVSGQAARDAMTVALCLPLLDEERLAREATRRGLAVVARCQSAVELTELIAEVRPSLVLTVAREPYFDAALLATCDAHGVRIVVGAGTRGEVRFARTLGVTDTVPTPVEWPAARADVLGRGAEEAGHLVGEKTTPTSHWVGRDGTSSGVYAREGDDAAARAPAARGRSLTSLLSRDRPEREAAGDSSRRGRVVAVWGTDGAPGRTSLAIALAAEIARTGARVALADADVVAASVAPTLGLLDEAPGFAAACRLAGLGTLTIDEFERLSERVPVAGGDVRVLTGIAHPNRWPELSAERVAGVLDEARRWVGVLVVDVAASIEAGFEPWGDHRAPSRNAATIAVLREADDVLLIGSADPVGMTRLIRAHASMAESLGVVDPLVVVNKVRSSVTGVAAEPQLRQLLARFADIHDPVLVPWDPAAFDAAVLTERPLVEASPRSRAATAVRAIAAALGYAPTPSVTRRGARRRHRRLA